MKAMTVVAIIGALLLAGCTHSPTAPHYVGGTVLSPYLGAASPASSVKPSEAHPQITVVDKHQIYRSSVVAR